MKYLAILIFAIVHLFCVAQITEEEIIFKNGDLEFYGTVFKATSTEPHTAFVLVHGSGEEHRKLRGYRSIAKMFAERGYLMLLYDKRGVGDSDGVYSNAIDLTVLAGDVVAAVQYLKTRGDVNQNKIGLFGHSQAGWIIPMAAIICEDIDFAMISCGGAVTPMEQFIYDQFERPLREGGESKEALQEHFNYLWSLFTYYGQG